MGAGCPPTGIMKSSAIEPRTPHSTSAKVGITDTKQYMRAMEQKAVAKGSLIPVAASTRPNWSMNTALRRTDSPNVVANCLDEC